MEEKIYKEISVIAQEASRAIGQLYIAPSEMNKIDMHGMRNVGWYRIGEVAKMFHWCGLALERLAAEHGVHPTNDGHTESDSKSKPAAISG